MNTAIYPRLIVVTGRPASGKTTLAHKLASTIRCPLVSRDEIKEGFVNTFNRSTNTESDVSRHIYNTFFETIEFLLNRQITLVAEAAFQHKLWSSKLEQLQKIARVKLVICTIDSELAKSRFIERGLTDPERANFHDDWAAQQDVSLLDRPYEPPQLNVPTLIVDTAEGYKPSFEAIVAFINNQQTPD